MITISDINLIINEALFMVIKLSLPILLTSMCIGLVISIFQTVTSIQEQTLTFLPKLLVILLVIALLGGTMFSSLAEYTVALFNRIPDFAK